MLRRQRWRKDSGAALPGHASTAGGRGAGEPISEAEGEETGESEWRFKGRGPIGTWGGCAAIEPQGEGEFERDHAPFARLRLLGARDEREPGAVRWGEQGADRDPRIEEKPAGTSGRSAG